jgi:hypothetical protein
MNDLINALDINVEHIKRILVNIFLIQIDKNMIWIDFTYDEFDFYNLFHYILMHKILVSMTQMK